VPVFGNDLECVPYFSRPEGEPPGDHENVTKVAPSGASRTALRCSKYLLGEDHLYRIAAELYRFLPEQARQRNLGRPGPDRVADANVNMKRLPCGFAAGKILVWRIRSAGLPPKRSDRRNASFAISGPAA
jgi:hypothetical protein